MDSMIEFKNRQNERSEPSVSLAIDPLALLLRVLLHVLVNANPVLLVVPPTANVFIAIGPYERALSIFLAVLEVALVLPAVTPCLHPSALHVAHPELALIPLVNVRKEVLAYII